jgi:hypothetical protein
MARNYMPPLPKAGGHQGQEIPLPPAPAYGRVQGGVPPAEATLAP